MPTSLESLFPVLASLRDDRVTVVDEALVRKMRETMMAADGADRNERNGDLIDIQISCTADRADAARSLVSGLSSFVTLVASEEAVGDRVNFYVSIGGNG